LNIKQQYKTPTMSDEISRERGQVGIAVAVSTYSIPCLHSPSIKMSCKRDQQNHIRSNSCGGRRHADCSCRWALLVFQL